jgi:hypothetical protein
MFIELDFGYFSDMRATGAQAEACFFEVVEKMNNLGRSGREEPMT